MVVGGSSGMPLELSCDPLRSTIKPFTLSESKGERFLQCMKTTRARPSARLHPAFRHIDEPHLLRMLR